MKNFNSFAFILFIALFVSSCGPSKEEKAADARLAAIQSLIDNQQYELASQQIDSVHLLYPKLIDKRKLAAALSDTLLRRQSVGNLAYCEKMLPLKIHEQDSLLKKFRYEKNDKYQTYGNFIYKTQVTEQNYDRTYLKCYVDENLDLYLISQCAGSALNHRIVKVSTGDVSVSSDSVNVDTGEFYSFTNDGMYFESMTFVNQKAKDLVTFIADNSDAKIKVELKGKRKLSYMLSDNDKKAIAETFKLWTVMHEVKQMTIEVNKSNKRLLNINNRNLKKQLEKQK